MLLEVAAHVAHPVAKDLHVIECVVECNLTQGGASGTSVAMRRPLLAGSHAISHWLEMEL